MTPTWEANVATPANFDAMVASMLKCEQFAGQSVYQHGLSVFRHFEELVGFAEGGCLEGKWAIPSWFNEFKETILSPLHENEIIRSYLIFHDCGKPYCRLIDENGKVHFPNHADISRRIWSAVGGCEDVARLIANDMVIHTASADEIDYKLTNEWSRQDAATLLLAALAEVHSNARWFGGIESVNFKMKFKVLERRGRQIMRHWSKSDQCGFKTTTSLT